ncbi:MAG TPA: hypothetical protein VLZ89_09160 [Anaerolineales bacterium]|nr:hypothetical protein [Anaerolineales bacterium]
MKNILIMCNIDPNASPRPNRMIRWLKDTYRVTVVGRRAVQLEGVVDSFVIIPSGLFGSLIRGNSLPSKIKTFLSRLSMFIRRDYEGLIWASLSGPRELRDLLAGRDFDLIITHDCTLLPLAFSIKGDKASPVMLDARDYYPRNFDDQLLWRIFVKPVNQYLCEKYLSLCDKVITVSDGLAREYGQMYRIEPEVVMSMPQARALKPVPVRPGVFRMIHHGIVSRSRRLDLMIEMMDYVDERFSLDLMLMGQGEYLDRLHAMAARRKNVRIVPPVPLADVVTAINQYDIGVYLLPPTNFNTRYTLPNKFFEFIQARLALAIGPSIEMKRMLQEYNCGIVSEDFSPRSLARALNLLLSEERIMYFKEQSHKAALKLNAEFNGARVLQIVGELIEGS